MILNTQPKINFPIRDYFSFTPNFTFDMVKKGKEEIDLNMVKEAKDKIDKFKYGIYDI